MPKPTRAGEEMEVNKIIKTSKETSEDRRADTLSLIARLDLFINFSSQNLHFYLCDGAKICGVFARCRVLLDLLLAGHVYRSLNGDKSIWLS